MLLVTRQAVLDVERFRETTLYAYHNYVEASPHYRSELACRREQIWAQVVSTSQQMADWFSLSNFDSWSYERLLIIYSELMNILSDIFYYRVSIVRFFDLNIPGIDE
jgi:hypothetical protein